MMDFCGAPLVHALVLTAGVSHVPWSIACISRVWALLPHQPVQFEVPAESRVYRAAEEVPHSVSSQSDLHVLSFPHGRVPLGLRLGSIS